MAHSGGWLISVRVGILTGKRKQLYSCGFGKLNLPLDNMDICPVVNDGLSLFGGEKNGRVCTEPRYSTSRCAATVEDFDLYEALLHHAYNNEMRQNPAEHPLMVSEASVCLLSEAFVVPKIPSS